MRNPWSALVLALATPACTTPTLSASAQVDDAPPVTLDPSRGSEIGWTFEAFLSPHQEPGEEEDTPALTPETFRSTAPSVPRLERRSRGHGMVRFTRDLSRAYVDLAIEGIDPATINLFHLHCGRPDQLGPILVDFSIFGELPDLFEGNRLQASLTFEDIDATRHAGGHGPGPASFLQGCPIVPGLPDDAKTVSGMKYVADQGDLYFNLHTTGQTFFGDIRGRLHPVE